MQITTSRDHRPVRRRLPHVVPDSTGDSNNGYARCEACGAEVYVGSGLHPNLGVPMDQADAEANYLRRGK